MLGVSAAPTAGATTVVPVGFAAAVDPVEPVGLVVPVDPVFGASRRSAEASARVIPRRSTVTRTVEPGATPLILSASTGTKEPSAVRTRLSGVLASATVTSVPVTVAVWTD